MTKGIPGLTGTDHIGITVPDIEAASAFFVEVLGCEALFDVGPFRADDDWMARHLNVHPRTEINKLRMLSAPTGRCSSCSSTARPSRPPGRRATAMSAPRISPSGILARHRERDRIGAFEKQHCDRIGDCC